ncbi:MAG: penicillin-binding protein 2 [Acetilactobacillus jinshanensis]
MKEIIFLNNFIKEIFHHQNHHDQSKIPFRLNFIFVIVGILFAVLIGQLAYLQVLNGPQFKAEVNRSDNTIKTGNVQRGMIYDSQGHLLVGNKSHRAITYTKEIGQTSSKMCKTADRLRDYIKVPEDALTKRQKADYYLANIDHSKAVMDKIKVNKKSESQTYDRELKYVMDSGEIHFTKHMKNAAEIYRIMNGAYQLSTTNIKSSNVNSKELAEVGEHLSEMPGVHIGTSWSRQYPEGKSIQTLAGTVSSEKTGLPSNEVNELTSEGYSRNDSVGQSYLEQEYEPALRGTKSQTQVRVMGGNKVSNEVKKYGGKKGDNLQLTINGKFQKQLQNLVKSADQGGVGESNGAYAVVMNPNNGDIIGMAGVNRKPSSGKITPNELGAINSDIVMGSVVKGATVSGALMDHVISPNNSIQEDKPIITDGTKKSSWFNHGGGSDMPVDASTALEVSSNSYMMQLAMKEAHFHYHTDANLDSISPSIFQTMRGYFNQFGLGVKTGIDLPGETTGIKGPSGAGDVEQALDESFGNYDAYTTIQLAQYMSTIANGGYRLQPHIVKDIRGTGHDGKLGRVEYSVEPNVLNEVPMTAAERNVVKEGLYDVVHGTNQYKTGISLDQIHPEISAKTGTAETYYHHQKTVTLSLASFAPSNHPQVVVALAIPNLPEDAETNNINLAKEIYKAYWADVAAKSQA